jgi:curved DNA-binding protein CbpA
MSDDQVVDYYELLQVSPNADPDMIHRVYRLLAQRLHPDNQESGDADRFRQLHEAYAVLSEPEKRAQYDILHVKQRRDRWRLVEDGAAGFDAVEAERVTRLTVLEVLYTRRRTTPSEPGIFDLDMESLVGRPREHLEFTFWYLMQKNLVRRADGSRLTITAEGVDYLESNYGTLRQVKRLPESSVVARGSRAVS